MNKSLLYVIGGAVVILIITTLHLNNRYLNEQNKNLKTEIDEKILNINILADRIDLSVKALAEKETESAELKKGFENEIKLFKKKASKDYHEWATVNLPSDILNGLQ